MTDIELMRLTTTAVVFFLLGLLVMYAVAWKYWCVNQRLLPLDELND